jgi:4-carboxymuconolactone decarboxylase
MTKKTGAERRAAGQDVWSTLRGEPRDGGPSKGIAALESSLGALGSFVVDFALGEVWSRPGLSRRDRSLITISVLATLNQLNQLRGHVQGGIRHGLTRTEIEETCLQLAAYAGFPRAIDAMNTVREALAEMGAAAASGAASAAIGLDDDQRDAAAAAVATTLFKDQPVSFEEQPLGPFRETAGRFVMGEVWAREALSRRDRSIVVCASLAAQDMPSELRFHLRGARNHGVTGDELEELMAMICVYAGFPRGVQGFHALRDVEAGAADG